MPSVRRRTTVNCLLVPLAFLALVLLLLYPTLAELTRIWMTNESYMHGPLIAALALYLLWRAHPVREYRCAPSLQGSLLVLALCLLWSVSYLLSVSVLEQAALLLMIPALMLAFHRRTSLRGLAFPVLLLLLAVPAGDVLVPWLMEVTARMAVRMVRWFGIDAALDGLVIMTEHGDFVVERACSGIRYLMATFTLGVLYAAYRYTSWLPRIVFLATALLFPIFANALRAAGIILLAESSGMRVAVDTDHILYGWLFFVMVFVLLLVLGELLARWDHSTNAEAASVVPEHERHAEREMEADEGKLPVSLVNWSLVLFALMIPVGSLWARNAYSKHTRACITQDWSVAGSTEAPDVSCQRLELGLKTPGKGLENMRICEQVKEEAGLHWYRIRSIRLHPDISVHARFLPVRPWYQVRYTSRYLMDHRIQERMYANGQGHYLLMSEYAVDCMGSRPSVRRILAHYRSVLEGDCQCLQASVGHVMFLRSGQEIAHARKLLDMRLSHELGKLSEVAIR